ncbi:rod-binding protein [Bradyrhizobium sp. U87765 SZCCT0131]|uniref:rod-binding protein n=1 Tax=unclassified Bradyrhizobium TaxID=2631580 RepID=UPI001BA6B7E6|nr:MULTISPECIES: rod-binding protein [unclassified Bradyrhizobium]MBR1216369.1 rod-binding protein [Bradyrhizobium sp. U87765 SZCCT0131]MBR1259883.1 rod-binding protein [Bradyrhizobium sp. U87765 SZCCT0134]MBR1306016.1 rod-binding protein [Bradyrhizobium sp. U87765 SZCCT0110]MBR1322383.1 rod-binding protein [Bradyrhizobium sp. U87765 SZCCT0109]MBR1352326.1 rod-binding protein [Bradyrhizobium sp. U87765 SZCCT0048]
MTVAPVQDLIVDVMSAADPAVQRLAETRLERLSSAAGGTFVAEMDGRIAAGRLAQAGPHAPSADAQLPVLPVDSGHAPVVRQVKDGRAVYRKFEAFVLQTFVESMLPEGASEVFGKGTAGTIWRSMLAEQIGNEMAKGDGIGIAKQLAKSRSTALPASGEG